MLTPLLLRFRGLVIMLTILYELEPEKYIDWTGLAVFPARKDCALASFKTKFSATPFVDELDESEKSVAHTASLHTAPCVDLFLKKQERTAGASVLFGVKLRTLTPLVYDLGHEKSTGCVGVFLDCALALLGGELGATPLEEFEESEKSALQTQIKIVLQDDRTDRGMAPHDWAVDGLVPLAVSCKVLVLDDPEYVHYNAKTIDLTSSQDKRFMLLKKTNVSNSANQYKCLARSQGREIFSSSCNALPIVTDDIAVTKRILGLPIKHGARVSQKDKFGLTFFFVILLLGWIPGVNAADENALLQGCTCTWICIIIITIALVYFAYKIYSLPPPEPYLFSEKVLVLDDPEYVHYNAENVDLTSSQDKCFTLLKKTSVSNSANQHKCPARSQGREIFSSSCNPLPIVTEDDTVTESSRNLWLPIKHGARVSQKDKLGLTFFFAILLPGWIPVVNAVDESAFQRGTISTCTWFWINIITIASAYCAYKILRRSPPEPYLFSEKVRIWINGEMNVEVYDDEGILVGSWRRALFTANGDAVDITEWVTNLLNFVLEIHVPQEDGRAKDISFNQMDDPEFIGMPKDVYLHNPDTGLLRYIGRSVHQNGAPSERDILRVRTILM
ncbi:hypothetical protein FF1_045162 [Malus domestica]